MEQDTHVLPKECEHDPKRIHGRVVRICDTIGKPTAFVGVVTRMRRSPLGIVCDVGGGGRRMVVPLGMLTGATVGELPEYTNVHKHSTGKSPLAIDGQESEL